MNISRNLNENSHRSVLGVFLNATNPNLQLHETAVRDGVESHLIPCRSRIDWSAVTRIRELATRMGADVVHAHGYKADIYVYFALRASKIPLVSTCHTWYDIDERDYLYGCVDRFILRSYASIVVVSEGVREYLLRAGVRPSKINMVRNGIDLRVFEHASPVLKQELGWDSYPLVGLVGRLSEEKGVDVFLASAVEVLSRLADTKFVVVGDGPDRAQLDALVDALGIRNSVHMLGRRDDMPAVYASLDVMVSSSRREGLPMAILEGMASRLPVVATAVGGVPTIVLNGKTGLLVPAAEPALIAAGIVELLQNAADRERLGAGARRLVEDEFSAQRMTSDYLRLYEAAIATIAKRGGRRGRSLIATRGPTK
ncbi:MAG: glycosyltransferase family 4 protein [Acidobacteriota bacterium]|nr:glycosyltransferase family 4 protein [Acidobacteriota bacterium]